MKTYKTRNRSTYTYVTDTGERITLRPGIDSYTGETITEEDIRRLHLMDDAEVRNNLKHARRPVAEWEKPSIEAWKTDHPYEDLPDRSNVSLDAEGEDEDGDADDAGKGYIAAASMALAARERVSPRVERLREVVETLSQEQQELYRRIVIEGEPAVAISLEAGVSEVAIHNRMEKIKKKIKKLMIGG